MVCPAMTERPGPQATPSGESEVWGMISTLLAGPVMWGLVGFLADRLVDPSRSVFTAIGVVVGFVTSFYIVYVKFGREQPVVDRPPTADADRDSGDTR